MKVNIRHLLINFLEGIYSGIPLCCTISYCKGREGPQAAKENNLSDEAYYKKYPCEYVQCRSCENKKHSIEIKKNGRLF